MFDGMHNISSRDAQRDWGMSTVKTVKFDVSSQPVTSYQNPWELAQMIEVFCARAPSTVLELGPYHGGTLYHFITNSAPGTKIAAVDYFDELLGKREATPDTWKGWLPDGVGLQVFEGDTRDPKVLDAVREHFSDGLEWLFIDATHDYECCLPDFEEYGSLVSPGGVIGIHDIRPTSMGTYRLWEEIRDAGYVTQQLLADPHSNDAGIGLVYL